MARRLAAAGPPREHLVLAGGGHTHALVLRMWAMQPRRRPHAWITLVNRRSTALYSGMVPGLVAGLYAREDCAIDLRHLADRAGVSFVEAEITGLDLAARELQLQGRPPLRFDWLSLDVGAVVGAAGGSADGAAPGDGSAASLCGGVETHTTSGVGLPGSLQPLPVMPRPEMPRPVKPLSVMHLPVKPLEPFLQWCARADADARQPLPVTGAVTVRGSGAAAVEVALALQARGQSLTLQTRPGGLALGSRRANRLLAGVLRRAGIQMRGPGDSTEAPDNSAAAREPCGAGASAGASIDCTGSRGPAWLRGSGLPLNQRGRVLTTSTLQVMAQPRIWACGDCGVVEADPRPPSGVWAVRAAPVLARNLEQAVEGR
ncbi:MAG: FAD-dependent oxidoreductase, partial [Cyanobacteriota bacterium]|nr:FAD-dependent oxidoreductase [Cyanobacteriota bacterium]